MVDISGKKKKDIRARTKKMLVSMDKVFDVIINKADEGKVFRDEDLRFIKQYPSIREELEVLIAESLKQVSELPEGKLKEFIDKLEWMIGIGKHEDVIEASGYYRCEKCGELHAKSRMCMYEKYNEVNKESAESEDLEDDKGNSLGLIDPNQLDMKFKGPNKESEELEEEDNE